MITPEELTGQVRSSHARERLLIDGLTEEELRVASPLPGWTRAHLLACRLVFLRAASRQIDYALAGRTIAFYEDGPDPRAADRAARDAGIDANVGRPAGALVRDIAEATFAVDRAWAALAPADWDRPARYRGGGTLLDVLFACWRESLVHCVDYELGMRAADWPDEFCVHMIGYLARRVPAGMRLELSAPGQRRWDLGDGAPVEVRGALSDLASWLGGRQPEGPLESSTGTLPDLGRGNVAQVAG